MKVLILSNKASYLAEAIYDNIRVSMVKPDALPESDVIISYGYRYILPKKIIERTKLAINIHISVLPWNRGADPNFWSWYDDTPKGVTIHQITEGVDQGPILAQKELKLSPSHTLKSSYDMLTIAACGLFHSEWNRIRNGYAKPVPQGYFGSYHTKGNMPHLPLGWDTPCSVVREMGRIEKDWRENPSLPDDLAADAAFFHHRGQGPIHD